MKTTLCFTFIFLIFLTFAFVPNSLGQATTPHNMVRVIYFVPRGRTPQRDINAKLDTLIKDVQTFFADEMERHGFGRKTFVLETDTDGKVVVHRMNGSNVDKYYHKKTRDKVSEEVGQQFDFLKNVYLIVVDVSTESIGDLCGYGYHTWNGAGDLGGNAFIPASGYCIDTDFGFALMTHELGHVFGLHHDFSNDAYVMSYGFRTDFELAPCTAEWLDANRYFNSRQRPPNKGRTMIRMLPIAASPPYGIRFQFVVSDLDGLQIAHLLTPATDRSEGPGDLKMIGCKTLTGVSQTVEFATTELTAQSKLIRLRIVDGVGNWTDEEYPINVAAVFPSKVVSIPDANLAAAIRGALGLTRGKRITQLDMLGLRELTARDKKITDLSGLEHARHLKYLDVLYNQITDITVLAKLPNLARLFLNTNRISDFTSIMELTNLVELDLSNNPIDDINPVTEMTQLRSLSLSGHQIQDLSLFAGMTDLRSLILGNNDISDLTPLTALTQLEELHLTSNQISDVSPLTTLTRLKGLYLGNNQISDLTPLTTLTQLKYLVLFRNQISDVSPIAGLVALRNLYLVGNPILNTSTLRTLLEKNSDLKPGVGIAQGPLVMQGEVSKPAAMYWVDTKNGTLHRTIGNSVEDLVPSVQNATSLAVDMANENLYWTEKTSNRAGKIQRANLDGTNVQLVKDLTSAPLDIALDTVSSKLYLTSIRGKVQRLNFDGTNFQANLIKGLESPTDITLDIKNSKVYWIENAGSIRRANFAGSEVETLARGLGTLEGITVANNKIYWTEQISGGVGKIQRADLNGENVETVATVSGAPHGIAVDPTKRKLYWTNAVGGIQRTDINGGYIENLVTELTTPGDFAVIPRVARVLVAESQRPPMYWVGAEVGTLHRLTGTTVENIAPNVQNATSLAVDTVNSKLYWTEKTGDRTGKVRRANLDGTNIELVKELTSVPHGIAVDITGRKLYLTNAWGKVQRLNVNGTNFEPNLITDLDAPQDLVLDAANSKAYWTENAGRIRRASLDGSNIQTVATELGTLGDIAIASGKVYWTEKTDENSGKIQRANLDGTNIETLATLTNVPFSIAVNIAERKLYWTNAEGKIQRANLNGSNIENLVTELSVIPSSIALGTAATDTTIAAAPTTIGVAPDETLLHPNYPNPFNPETWIPYQLSKSTDVTLRIYAVNGTLVRTLALGHQPMGMYQNRSRAAYWDGRNAYGEPVASGIYFYTLTAGDFTATRKMLIRK